MNSESLGINHNGQKEDTKNRLLDAAESLFCEKGFSGVSVRELTAAADCNLAAVNYYFGGKEKLYTEMFRRQFDMMIQRNLEFVDHVMSDPETTLEKLLFAIIAPPIKRVVQNERGGKIMQLLIREVMNRQIDVEYICKDMKTNFFDRIGNAIVQLVPELPKEKLLMVVFSFDGVVLHPFLFMDFYKKTMPDMRTEELVEHMVRFVAAAIRGYASPNREGC